MIAHKFLCVKALLTLSNWRAFCLIIARLTFPPKTTHNLNTHTHSGNSFSSLMTLNREQQLKGRFACSCTLHFWSRCVREIAWCLSDCNYRAKEREEHPRTLTPALFERRKGLRRRRARSLDSKDMMYQVLTLWKADAHTSQMFKITNERRELPFSSRAEWSAWCMS